MPTITVRKLNPTTWEPFQGNGQSNFISDIDAVAQIIKQRLQLLQGEWWADTNDGLPFWQSIAGYAGGANSAQNINLLIQARILGTPFVTGLTSVNAAYNPANRSYTFSATVQTQFGAVTVTNAPTPPNRALPQ